MGANSPFSSAVKDDVFTFRESRLPGVFTPESRFRRPGNVFVNLFKAYEGFPGSGKAARVPLCMAIIGHKGINLVQVRYGPAQSGPTLFGPAQSGLHNPAFKQSGP